jgi:hypothetical protein
MPREHLWELVRALQDGSIAARKKAVAALDKADCSRVALLIEPDLLRHKPGRPFGSTGLTLKYQEAAQLVVKKKEVWRRQNCRSNVPGRKADEFIREALEEMGLELSDDNVQGVRLLFRNGRAKDPATRQRKRLTLKAR